MPRHCTIRCNNTPPNRGWPEWDGTARGPSSTGGDGGGSPQGVPAATRPLTWRTATPPRRNIVIDVGLFGAVSLFLVAAAAVAAGALDGWSP